MCIHTVNILKSLPSPIDVELYSDMSTGQASVVWLHKAIFKKFHDDKMSKRSKLAALNGFLESNEICRNWHVKPESYNYDLLLKVKSRLWEIFHSGVDQACVLSLHSCVDNGLPGPGSSLSTKETSFIGKVFHSKLSTYDASGSLYLYYRDALSYRWAAAERQRGSEYGLEHKSASKMSFAYKSLETARTINTEASLEMLLQKGAAKVIESLLKKFFNIDLSKQPRLNRMLARLGSLDGSNATIDLKDGSNRISYRYAEFVLPCQAFRVLDRIRAKCMEIPESLSDIGSVNVEMFSTQGNGFTFALQTLLFAVSAEVIYGEMRLAANCHEYPHFSVFGDDIIVAKCCYDPLVSFLTYCGFTVNALKSFNTGHFRESCGADFFKGHNIRGVYIQRFRLENHKYSAFNRLSEWSARNGIDISHALRYIKGLVKFRPVPYDEGDECGLKIPASFLRSPKFDSNGATRYTGYAPLEKFLDMDVRFGGNVIAVRDGVEIYSSVNQDGTLVALLGGYINSRGGSLLDDKTALRDESGYLVRDPARLPTVRQGFTERQIATQYALKRRSTSSWDFVPRQGLTTLDFEAVMIGVIT